MNHSMKRICLLLSALICTTTCSMACSSKSSSSQTIITSDELNLRSSEPQISENLKEMICIDKSDQKVLVLGKNEDENLVAVITNNVLGERKYVDISDNYDNIDACLMPNGNIAVLLAEKSNLKISIYDTNGENLNSYQIEDMYDEDKYIKLYCTDSGFYVCIGHEKLVNISLTGENLGVVDIEGGIIYGIFNTTGEEPFVLMNNSGSISTANINGNKLSDKTTSEGLNSGIYTACSGIGDYSVIACLGDAIYGQKENEWVKLYSFVNCDFSPYEIKDIVMASEKEFIVLLNKTDGSTQLRILSENEFAEAKEKQIIKIAFMIGKGSIINDDAIRKFNAESDKYSAEIINYGEIAESPEEMADKLKMDIISGDAPDIVRFSPDISLDSIGPKESLFADLYNMIDNDSELAREDFIDGFLEGFEYNDKLLMLDNGFELETVCINNKFSNGMKKWSYDEFSDFCDNIPEGILLSTVQNSLTKTELFMEIVNYNSFIDYTHNKCSFDSPEFIKMMKIIKDNGYGLSVKEKNMNGFRELFLEGEAYRNGSALIEPCHIGNFYSIKEQINGRFNGSATLIGCPSNNGSGTYRLINSGYAIMANSENIEGAWEYLKYLLFSDDMYDENWERRTFSGLKKRYEQQLGFEKEKHEVTDAETGEIHSTDVYYTGGSDGKLITLEPFSDDEAERYDELVRKAVRVSFRNNRDVENIVKEELNYYFEDERSAEDTVRLLQSRISLILSENS